MGDGVELTGDEWTLASFAGAIHRGGVGLWAWSPERRLAQLDSLCREFWGMQEDTVSLDDLFARVNDEDRATMMREWFASATDPHHYSFDFRIGDGPETRWISARGMGGDAGRVGEWIQAIFLDITERKQAEEAQRLLTAELAHRVSNMFTVARALTSIVAREARSVPDFVEDLSKRFGVLHQATTLAARSQTLDQGQIRLQDLVERILSPYHSGGDIAVTIPDDALVGPGHANDYAMIFHELATNSAKYGALASGGALAVTGTLTNHVLALTWDERVSAAKPQGTDGTGFGSRLLRQTIERSLRGSFERTITEGGMRFAMTVPVAPDA